MSKQLSEFSFIETIRRNARSHPHVPIGIGDDAAWITSRRTHGLLVATDMLLEGTHFTMPPATPELVGRKALAVNLSDIAAMAGRPIAAFVSLGLPQDRSSLALRIMQGLSDLAGEYGISIAGGDTTSWSGRLAINVCVVGEPLGPRPITRSGARPGDVIVVTGELGGSLNGHHLTFTPRVHEIAQILEIATPTAMIDVSDGTAADLYHILDESHVGAVIDAASLPRRRLPNREAAGLDAALGDGEDFELLMTFPPTDVERLLQDRSNVCRLTPIGTIQEATEDKPTAELRDPDGTLRLLPRSGYSHPV